MTVVSLNEGRDPAVTPPVLPRTHKVMLENLALTVDIGFHDFEIGTPQRLLASVSVTLDLAHWPATDTREASWNYDVLRTGMIDLIAGRRFNLQETLAEEIFAMIASRPGVVALTVWLKKPDVYADAEAVGVMLSSE